jgi:glycine betaine/proline transport system permease protein
VTVVESEREDVAQTKEQQPYVAATTWRDRIPTWWLVGAVVVVWVAIWSFAQDHDTLEIGGQEVTGVHDWLLNRFNDVVNANNVVIDALHKFGEFLNWLVNDQVQPLISQPDIPRPYPQIGWLGVIAIAVWIGLAVAGWRSAILVGASFLAFGYLGLWQDSLDTLIIVLIAVLLAVIIGLPLAVWMGRSKIADAAISPVLDILQTFPAFTYLLPLVLFYAIGASTAVIATFLFAIPPVIRIAALGIRTVSPTTIEATRSLGQTRWQEIKNAQLPMAKRTIIVGINQTTMAALSMVIIAAFVDAPGLGPPVLQGLIVNKVGDAFVPGLAIVIMAIMLDRTTTAASERAERLQRAGGGNRTLRYAVLGAAAVGALVCVYLSHYYTWAAAFPKSSLGDRIDEKVQSFSDWVSKTVDTQTGWVKEQVSLHVLNPLQDLIATSPWYVTGAAILLIAAALGGRWAALTTAVCLFGLYILDLWYNAMITLNMTLVATVFVMVLALIFGVWMGRSRIADLIIRPILDALQVLPPFIYLIPAIALFDVSRFTAIVAAIAFAAPAAIKIVADGIRGVSPTTIEAATAAGSNRWQIITKVQIPMARGAVVLAANQGLLYVLSMVVIGGLVGGGALGYDVVAGFSQEDLQGRGLAASISIVLLGIMLDRTTRRAAMRVGTK